MMGKYKIVIEILAKPVASIRAMRLAFGIELKNALQIVRYMEDRLPCTVLEGVERENAEHIRDILQKAGFSVVLEKSEARHPMLLFPNAGKQWYWNWLLGLRPMKEEGNTLAE